MGEENVIEEEVKNESERTKKKRSRRNMPFAMMPASECTTIPESILKKWTKEQKIKNILLFRF